VDALLGLKDQTNHPIPSVAGKLAPRRSTVSVTSRTAAALGLLALAAAPLFGADDKEQLRDKLKDAVVQGAWIYDDLGAGFAEAKKTGKPLLVVLRCVPCAGYREIDKQVASRDPEVAKLLDQFVTVRVVQAYGLDLSLLQCDSDMNWSVFFLNADRTVYGRYSTRTGRDPSTDVSLDGFARAMEGALELHAQYPKNKEALAAKTPLPPRWPTPEKMPVVPGKVVPADGSRQNCLHCHDIQPGRILSLRKEGQTIDDRELWPYPKPDLLGLKFDVKERATLKAVEAGSAAERAGFMAGDKVLTLQGQPLVSIADVQWVLHNAAAGAKLQAEVKRGEDTKALTLELAEGWRKAGDTTWRPAMWPLRMWVAGFRSQPPTPQQRKDVGLPDDAAALRLDFMPPDSLKERNQAPAKAGMKLGDVLVEVDGQKEPLKNEGWFLAYLVQKKKPGDKVKLTALRGGQRMEFEVLLP
jgi:serine protease Do